MGFQGRHAEERNRFSDRGRVTAARLVLRSGQPWAIRAVWKTLLNPVRPLWDNRHDFINGLSAHRALLSPLLADAFKHPDPKRRARAINLFSEYPDTQLVPAIIDLILDKDADVRYAAIEAIAKLRDVRAVPSLLVALDDVHVAFAAAEALASVCDYRLKPDLFDMESGSLGSRLALYRAFLSPRLRTFVSDHNGTWSAQQWRELVSSLKAEGFANVPEYEWKSLLDFEARRYESYHRFVPSKQAATSEFWRCPSCRAVLKKDATAMQMWTNRQVGASVGGSVTCGGCQSAYAFAAVYGGSYDLPVIELTCHACHASMRGPSEELRGHPCPACGAVLK